MKRKKISRKGSKRLFKATATKMHKKNLLPSRPMRGGYRI